MSHARRIVLTGVSRGLGLALTEGLIERGHTIFGCARSADDVARLKARYGAPHAFTVVDVADDEQVYCWAEGVLAAGGPPDLLINNAAVINRNACLWEVPPGEFARLIDINIKGVFHVVRHFVPAMVKKSHGVIVNLSSGWGRTTSPEVAPYCASKWAIEGLTRALADELPYGMAAVPLNPGIIYTDMLQSCFQEDAKNFPTPKRWAQVAVPFLLSLGPSHNGEPLSVPGAADEAARP